MGSLNLSPELSLDFKPTFIPKTISQFLAQLTKIGSLSDKVFKVDDFISRLETEMRKIDAFKRELPLCMLLINDAIVALKEELMVLKRSSKSEPVLEEFIPLKKSCDEEEVEISKKEKSGGGGDKKNWLSSTQLWNTNDTNRIENGKLNSVEQVTKKRAEENDDSYKLLKNPPVRAFIPFKGCFEFPMMGGTREEDREELPIPALSLNAPGIKNCFTGNILLAKTSDNSKLIPCAATNGQSNIQTSAPQSQPPHQQASRKQRRCWSAELHRRFVNALQQLGGSQAATPKQIRELMQVDGLTNDEVKSHLQKYRLHTRRLPSSNNSSANQSSVVLGGGLWMSPQDQYVESSKHGISQSGSPDGPLLIGTMGGTSTTGGESMDDGEDTKSENYCWKGPMHTSGNDDGYKMDRGKAVLVNGSPTFEFQCSKGMRQGDPISPFLFLIVMEGLSSMMRKASVNGAVKGIVLPNHGPEISHLLYADDCTFVGDWSELNVIKLVRILRVFNLVSGLKINMGKSMLFGVGVESGEVKRVAKEVDCRSGEAPFDYLGIKIGGNMNRIKNWDFLVEIFKRRLSNWKASSLSIGGRVTLIKAVLESLPTYYFSLFRAPIKVLENLEGIIRRFFWGGSEEKRKIYWVAWEVVTSPINKGGLGLTKLKDSNVALLTKWVWRYHNEPENLWRKVIDAVHNSKRNWSLLPCRKNHASVWCNIVKTIDKVKVAGQDLGLLFRGKVGNGKSIRFWVDPWLEPEPLRKGYPNLFKDERNKNCFVFDKLNPVSNLWELGIEEASRNRTGIVEEENRRLGRKLELVKVSSCRDKWEWGGRGKREFSVKGVKDFLRSDKDYSNRFVFKWSKWIPRKCNIFMWRVALDRLPTGKALRLRNCNINSSTCAFCGDEEEDLDHLFCSCIMTSELWYKVSQWCKIPPVFLFSTMDIFEIHKSKVLNSTTRKVMKGIVILTCWTIWKTRNEKKFNNAAIEVKKMFEDIMALGFLYYKNRVRGNPIEWENWCKFDFTVNV